MEEINPQHHPKRGRPPLEQQLRLSQLMDAATNVFLQKGFHTTRIDDIVALAGTGKGTFYQHFKNKEDIFEAILDKFFNELQETLTWTLANVRHTTSINELFEEETFRIVEILTKNKTVGTLLVRDARSAGDQIENKVSQLNHNLIKASAQTLHSAMVVGLLPKFNENVGAMCIIGGIEKVYERWLKGEVEEDLVTLAKEVLHFMLRGCGLDLQELSAH